MEHSHNFEGTDWPFADPENTAVFACSHVIETKPILHVVHDVSDGAWQFLCGDDGHETAHARIVCFGCMVSREPSLKALADLPMGWMADRTTPDAPWERCEHPGYDDEDAG